MKKLIVSLGLALTLSFGATLDEGAKALEKGDYKKALIIFCAPDRRGGLSRQLQKSSNPQLREAFAVTSAPLCYLDDKRQTATAVT